MKYIGLVINPIAGMGGRVGLKGTDGKHILTKARELGSVAEAPIKAKRALSQLSILKDELTFLVADGDMGENVVRDLGFNYEVIYQSEPGDTDAKDTLQLCQEFLVRKVELLIFVGGDGTARDVYSAVGTKLTSIGVPAGVKIHSPVYGNSPERSGRLALEFLQGQVDEIKAEEVMDIEEEAFRRDEIQIQVFGYLMVPYKEEYLQNLKSPSQQSDAAAQESAALYAIDLMEEDTIYIIGSGTTTAIIMEELGLDHTILGVDIIKNKQLLKKDANESDILNIVGQEKFKIIITPMGGQGYIFGRGNQQLSAQILNKIEKEDIIIIATPQKLQSLGQRDLLLYTMDDEIDEKLTAYYKVIIGYGQMAVKKATSAK